MARKGMTVICVAFCLVLVGSPVSTQSADPWIGSWKLDLAKSTFTPGPGPKSNRVTIETAAGGAQKHTFDGVNAQGQAAHSERLAKFDGTDIPLQAVTPASNNSTTNAFRRVGDRSFEVVVKVGGTVTTTNRIVVSADGRTLTQTTTGINAQGQTVSNVSVCEKNKTARNPIIRRKAYTQACGWLLRAGFWCARSAARPRTAPRRCRSCRQVSGSCVIAVVGFQDRGRGAAWPTPRPARR
jgi:hypothetical protein